MGDVMHPPVDEYLEAILELEEEGARVRDEMPFDRRHACHGPFGRRDIRKDRPRLRVQEDLSLPVRRAPER